MSIFVSLCCVRSWHLLKLFVEQLPPWLHPVFSSFVVVLVSFGRLQNLSLFDTKFDVSGMRHGQGEREEARADKMQIVRYTIGDGWGLESGWKWKEGSVIVYAITTFRFRGKVACLVASFVVHAASSGAYLQHFCGTWLHAGGGIAAMATDFGRQNSNKSKPNTVSLVKVNCSHWLWVLCIELGSTMPAGRGKPHRGKRTASLDDCKQLC